LIRGLAYFDKLAHFSTAIYRNWTRKTTGSVCTRSPRSVASGTAGRASPAYNPLVCCQCRPELESEDYWFGLHKFTAQRGWFGYWYATTWLDGNTSPWRDYARRYPRYRYDTCFRYTKDGWKDKPCDAEYYYTCKQAPGMCRFCRRRRRRR